MGKHMHVGDEISILFHISKEKGDIINYKYDRSDDENRFPHAYIDTLHDDEIVMISIPFIIIKRVHGMYWKCVGNLESTGISITVQSPSKDWEDIFRWVCMNKEPKWADEIRKYMKDGIL